jgi:hypothetical protein
MRVMVEFEGETSEQKEGDNKKNPLLTGGKVFHQCQISKSPAKTGPNQ